MKIYLNTKQRAYLNYMLHVRNNIKTIYPEYDSKIADLWSSINNVRITTILDNGYYFDDTSSFKFTDERTNQKNNDRLILNRMNTKFIKLRDGTGQKSPALETLLAFKYYLNGT